MKERTQTLHWFVHRVTGAILFIGLGLHFYVMHFAGSGAITHQAVAARLAEPGWIAFNLVFLASAIYHGFNGLWGMTAEYIHSIALRNAARSAICGVGTILMAVGIYILTLG